MLCSMKFTKMHGLGNDYVYVNGFAETVRDPSSLSKTIADRHFGIGSDGLILILPSTRADVRMRMFNADGSEGEMCGNGIRCVAKYAYDHGLSKSNPMRVETGRGVLTLELKTNAKNTVQQVTVNMGEPILDLAEIPVDRDKLVKGSREHEYRIAIERPDELVEISFVSMGNPHSIVFVPSVDEGELPRVGPIVEHHKAF